MDPYEASKLDNEILLTVSRDVGLEKLATDYECLNAEICLEQFSNSRVQLRDSLAPCSFYAFTSRLAC